MPTRKLAMFVLLIAAAALLIACGLSDLAKGVIKTEEPTVDPAPIHTSAAATVMAQLVPTKPALPNPILEDFDDLDDLTLSPSAMYSGDAGMLNWLFFRDGDDQYASRRIPSFSGDVRLTVAGSIIDWSNNCSIGAGIGNAPGEGLNIRFGFYGGGCDTSGPVIFAGGVDLDMHENPSCTFSDNWPWVEDNRQYEVTLTVRGSDALFELSDGRSIPGRSLYDGKYSVLWAGGTGDGDWPACSGTIDYIKVEPLE